MTTPKSKASLALVAGGTAVVLAFALAFGALPPLQAIALAVGGAVCAVLGWELRLSRRRLMEEHAAHVAKSMYLANMSHELRTPLNAIIGFSELMRCELMGPVGNPKYGEYLGDIHESASHLLDLINDVLEMSRIEAGRLVLHEAPVDITAVLVSCHRLLRERARRAGVELRVEIDADLPEVMCDPAKIRQIILNLATNAVKFTPRGGRVVMTAGLAAGALELAVADTGIGIARKDIPRVMTPFVQAANSRVLSSEGAGLGLPLAKRLTELHGGTLALASELGRGTRVAVTLPPSRCLTVRPAPAQSALRPLAEQPAAA
jgi:signal transduction histidine kinase